MIGGCDLAIKKLNILIALFVFALLGAIFVPIINTTIVLPNLKETVVRNEEHHSVIIANHIVNVLDIADSLSKDNNLKTDGLLLMIEGLDIMKLRIFDSEGMVLYSTANSEIGTINKHEYFNNIVSDGKTLPSWSEKISLQWKE